MMKYEEISISYIVFESSQKTINDIFFYEVVFNSTYDDEDLELNLSYNVDK